MPELPEVETVRAGLEKLLSDQPVVKKVKLMRADIRFPIPRELPKRLQGQKIQTIRRRAKYILFDTAKGVMLSHLGMTGSWRFTEAGDEDKHDHCYIEFSDGRRLAYRDPRRFGILDWIEPGKEAEHPRLKDLGVEPLDTDAFHEEFLFQASRKRRVPVKAFIMDQRIVVGIGNIYASEALFRAGVRPTRQAGRLTKDECARIVKAAQEVLREAIKVGGSSIRDYRQADGEEGGFQDHHFVYDRDGLPCRVCGCAIKSRVIGGRSTYWCAKCQL